MELAKLTWKEIENLPRNAIFFLTIGPMEAHGPHLPVSTDFEVAKRVEKEAMKLMEEENFTCVSMPPLPVGSCHSLQGFAGTISTEWKNLYALIHNSINSMVEHGFKYFVIVNFHMDMVHLRGIYKAMKDLKKRGAIIVEPLSPCYFNGILFEDIKGEVHADMKETSLALYLFPEYVREYNLKDFRVKFNILNSMKKFKDLGAENAYIGSPSKASPEYGKRAFERMVKCCVEGAKGLYEGKIMELPGKIKFLLKI